MAQHQRPRPSSIDLLPEECEAVVAWAAQELANTERSQVEIYKDFSAKLEDVRRELGLDFEIPHYRSFTRHNLKLAKLTARMNRSQMIADAVIARTDGADADNLTQAAIRMLKTLVVEMMENASDDGFKAKEASNAATALLRLSQAEGISTERRRKVEAEFEAKAKEAVTAVVKAKGITEEGAKAILTEILGVEP